MIKPFHRTLIILFALAPLTSCGSDDAQGPASSDDPKDATPAQNNNITNAIFTRSEPGCASYVGEYYAEVTDVANQKTLNASVTISDGGDTCTFSSNSIPNHDFNQNGSFANDVKEVVETFQIPKNPTAATSSTALSLSYDNAVFLNGVKLDLLAAACYGVGNEPLGKEKIGCFEEKPWRYDPMFGGNNFGTDTHNAHTQPDGAYHYHGSPEAMFADDGSVASPVIGFAADGFPIFGPYIDDNGSIRKVISGYTLKAGARTDMPGQGALPPGDYDGTFRDDYEFTSAGDLDACNGMTRNGSYGYYITDTFPWVLGCFTGTPHASFQK